MKVVERRYMPKILIYDVLPILDMMVRDDNIIFVNGLRDYYGIPEIDSIFWRVDPMEKYKMVSYTYRYHGRFMQLFLDYKSGSGLPRGGYEPSPATKIISGTDLEQKEPTGDVVDSIKIYYLEKFIKEYKDKTKLIFVISPRYNFKTSNTVSPLRKLCEKYNVVLLDHYADPRFVYKKEFYGDGNHMNVTGATAWSKFIASEIMNYIR